MPYVSTVQRRYFNANRERLESEGVDVDEWNQASKGKKMPERTKKEAFAIPWRTGLGTVGGGILGTLLGRYTGGKLADQYKLSPIPHAAARWSTAGLGGALGGLVGGTSGFIGDVSNHMDKRDKKKREKESMDTKKAVEKMSAYLRFLAETRTGGLALHTKQAAVDKITTLSRNLDRTKSLGYAIAMTYPEKSASDQQKLFIKLAHCLHKRIKQAELRKKAMGTLGEATVGNVQMAPSASKVGPAAAGNPFTGM